MSNSDFEGSHVVATSLLSGPLCFQPFPCKALKSKWKKPQQVSPYLNQEPESGDGARCGHLGPGSSEHPKLKAVWYGSLHMATLTILCNFTFWSLWRVFGGHVGGPLITCGRMS